MSRKTPAPPYIRAYAIRKAQDRRRKRQYWAKRWEKDPDSMRRHLDKLNAPRVEHGRERMDRLRPLLEHLGKSGPVMSADLKPRIREWITTREGVEPQLSEVVSVIAFLRRKGAIAFEVNECAWRVMVA